MQDSLAQGRILHYTKAVQFQYADTSIIGLFLSAGPVSCSDGGELTTKGSDMGEIAPIASRAASGSQQVSTG